MPHLLHIDSSVQEDRSVSRRLTARAADRWRAAHPGGTVTYRDLAADPLPHLDPGQSAPLSAELVDEIKTADTVLLGLPLYNYGPPSTVKAWVDHVLVDGLSVDFATGQGLLTNPAMSELKGLAAQSLADGQAQIDLLWEARVVAV